MFISFPSEVKSILDISSKQFFSMFIIILLLLVFNIFDLLLFFISKLLSLVFSLFCAKLFSLLELGSKSKLRLFALVKSFLLF